MDALPPPGILAHLTAPGSACVISHRYTDDEDGNFTTARCNGRSVVIARDRRGDTVRRVSRCSIMLTINGIHFPELLRASNCRGALRIERTGDIWTRQLLKSAGIAPSWLEGVQYEALAHRPACYRVAIVFTPPGRPVNTSFDERSMVRCAN